VLIAALMPSSALALGKTMTYSCSVQLWWADEDADYIRTRSARYRDALDIQPGWTQEVLIDDRLVELSPCPTSVSGRLDSSAGPVRRGGCSW
jgi:hypothetical protein